MGRRGENIYRRKDGRWEARLLLRTGKYKSFYGKTYKEAKLKMRLFQENAKNPIHTKKEKRMSTVALLEEWLKNQESLNIKPLTYESYYHTMKKHILPFFEDEGSPYFSEESIAKFSKRLCENISLADSSKKKVLTILKIALKDIVKNDYNAVGILEAAKLPRAERKEVEIFSKEEQRRLENAVLKAKDPCALGILLCLYTGIRLGELCALTWGDVDWEMNMIAISKTVSRVKTFQLDGNKTELQIGTPKSRDSMRKIPAPHFIFDLFRERELCLENKRIFIFSGQTTPMDPRKFQKLYKRILVSEHLPDRKFHAVRHTFATRGLELGVDIKTLSELLGHSSVSITLNTYAHSLLEQKRAAMEKFNAMHIASNEIQICAV